MLQGQVDLLALGLGEEQEFVGSFNELLFLGPFLADLLDLSQYFIVLQPQHNNFVLENCVL